MGRMLRVIRAALPASEEQGASAGAEAAAGAGVQELWRQHAEYEGDVRVLTWTGIGRSSATWCPRYGVVYQASEHAAMLPVFTLLLLSPGLHDALWLLIVVLACIAGKVVPVREQPAWR